MWEQSLDSEQLSSFHLLPPSSIDHRYNLRYCVQLRATDLFSHCCWHTCGDVPCGCQSLQCICIRIPSLADTDTRTNRFQLMPPTVGNEDELTFSDHSRQSRHLFMRGQRKLCQRRCMNIVHPALPIVHMLHLMRIQLFVPLRIDECDALGAVHLRQQAVREIVV